MAKTNINALPKGTMIDPCATEGCPNTAVRKLRDTPYCEECYLENENEPAPQVNILTRLTTVKDGGSATFLDSVGRKYWTMRKIGKEDDPIYGKLCVGTFVQGRRELAVGLFREEGTSNVWDQRVVPDEPEKSLEEIKHETIQLPADVSIWYTTRRYEMLKMIKRDMGPEEVAAVMDVLAGEMRMREVLERIIQTYEECVEIVVSERNAIEGACQTIRQEIKDTAATIQHLKGGQQ